MRQAPVRLRSSHDRPSTPPQMISQSEIPHLAMRPTTASTTPYGLAGESFTLSRTSLATCEWSKAPCLTPHLHIPRTITESSEVRYTCRSDKLARYGFPSLVTRPPRRDFSVMVSWIAILSLGNLVPRKKHAHFSHSGLSSHRVPKQIQSTSLSFLCVMARRCKDPIMLSFSGCCTSTFQSPDSIFISSHLGAQCSVRDQISWPFILYHRLRAALSHNLGPALQTRLPVLRHLLSPLHSVHVLTARTAVGRE